MNEQIIRIEEVTFKRSKDDWQEFDGYQVITDKQTIKLGISNSQSCCENWGYLMSDDNLKEFEGAELKEITLTDVALKTEIFKSKDIDLEGDWEKPNLMFVNFSTDKGLLQFAAYNEHNGYYGHNAIVISEQLNHQEVL